MNLGGDLQNGSRGRFQVDDPTTTSILKILLADDSSSEEETIRAPPARPHPAVPLVGAPAYTVWPDHAAPPGMAHGDVRPALPAAVPQPAAPAHPHQQADHRPHPHPPVPALSLTMEEMIHLHGYKAQLRIQMKDHITKKVARAYEDRLHEAELRLRQQAQARLRSEDEEAIENTKRLRRSDPGHHPDYLTSMLSLSRDVGILQGQLASQVSSGHSSSGGSVQFQSRVGDRDLEYRAGPSIPHDHREQGRQYAPQGRQNNQKKGGRPPDHQQAGQRWASARSAYPHPRLVPSLAPPPSLVASGDTDFFSVGTWDEVLEVASSLGEASSSLEDPHLADNPIITPSHGLMACNLIGLSMDAGAHWISAWVEKQSLSPVDLLALPPQALDPLDFGSSRGGVPPSSHCRRPFCPGTLPRPSLCTLWGCTLWGPWGSAPCLLALHQGTLWGCTLWGRGG